MLDFHEFFSLIDSILILWDMIIKTDQRDYYN